MMPMPQTMRLWLLLPVLAVALVLAFAQSAVFAQGSPGTGDAANTTAQETKPALKSAFTRPAPSATAGAQTASEQQGDGSWWQWIAGGWAALWRWLLAMQRELQHQIADAIRGLKTGDTATASLALITVSFLYGIFHAVGPGHGKGVISSYVLANKATLRRGIVLSFLSALMQAFSALIIVGTVIIVLNRTGLDLQFRVIPHVEMVSSALILVAGLWLLIAHLRRRYGAHTRTVAMHPMGADVVGHADGAHIHHHGENCGCGHSHMPDAAALAKKLSLREAAAIVFAVGIRPCTGAIGALLFARQIHIWWAGVVSTFVMALGTAITVSMLAALAVGSRDQAVRLAANRWTDGIYNIATILGCLLVMLVGAGLLWDAMQPARPF